MSWLCGTAATCAANPQAAFRRPDTVEFAFLKQTQQAAYFRAFSSPGLSRTEIAGESEAHLRRAAENAGWPSETWHTAPVFIGSGSYLISEYENRYLAGETTPENHLLHLAADLRERSGNCNIFSFATSCTSSAHALIQADRFLSLGLAERAFVLGIESLNRLTLLHFHSLGLLTADYRPFGGNGLILGEGAAALALSAAEPQSKGRLKLAGHAAGTGSHLVQSDTAVQESVIRRAIAAAGITPAGIALVKTHGIGTVDSDAAEMQVLHKVFGTPPPLAALKPQTGHTLGASAALETALLAQALRSRTLTDIHGHNIPLSDGLFCLANHFGFGGSNTATVWQWTP